MKIPRSFRLATILALISVAMMLGVGGGCSLSTYTPPRGTIFLEPAPLVVDGPALYAEWLENPEAAIAKYGGKKLYFKGVTVEQVSGAAGEIAVRKSPVKLCAAQPGDIAKIKAGDMVDAVGVLSGVKDDRLVITDCWIRAVDPMKAGY